MLRMLESVVGEREVIGNVILYEYFGEWRDWKFNLFGLL